jgi:predicted secreted protein
MTYTMEFKDGSKLALTEQQFKELSQMASNIKSSTTEIPVGTNPGINPECIKRHSMALSKKKKSESMAALNAIRQQLEFLRKRFESDTTALGRQMVKEARDLDTKVNDLREEIYNVRTR